jgi:uncharacterized protein (UPF0333 family)
MMKGQSSLEVLVTVGIILAFTIPVVFLLLSLTSVGYEKTATAQADASARSLADTMNFVYAQGPGAKKVMLMNVPASTQEVFAENGEVVIRIKIAGGGTIDEVSPTFAKIADTRQTTRDFPTGQLGAPGAQPTGLFMVIVSANNNGEVEFSAPS